MKKLDRPQSRYIGGHSSATIYGGLGEERKYVVRTHAYPTNLLEHNLVKGLDKPYAQPLALMRHFVESYSNPGDIVLDFCMGSGTTGVAAIAAGRHFAGIERDKEMYAYAEARMKS